MMRSSLLLALLLAAGCSSSSCPTCSSCMSCPECPSCTSCCSEAKNGTQDADKKKEEAKSLFDGKSLAHWKATEYGGQGEVSVKDGEIKVEMGAALSGLTWSGGELPKTNYEVSLEALKVDGDDIFCGLCFPVGDAHCSWVAGGWGGQVTGLSSVDDMNASENDTTKIKEFKPNQWYKFRLRVTPAKIEAWIDGKLMVDQELKDHKISLHPAMDLAKPFGIATYTTTSKFKNILLKKLP